MTEVLVLQTITAYRFLDSGANTLIRGWRIVLGYALAHNLACFYVEEDRCAGASVNMLASEAGEWDMAGCYLALGSWRQASCMFARVRARWEPRGVATS